jgi:hypothetical protein
MPALDDVYPSTPAAHTQTQQRDAGIVYRGTHETTTHQNMTGTPSPSDTTGYTSASVSGYESVAPLPEISSIHFRWLSIKKEREFRFLSYQTKVRQFRFPTAIFR